MSQAQDALLDDLFAAIENGDADGIARVFAPDIVVWHNITDRGVDREMSLKILASFVRRVSDRRYEILERRHWDGGAVQRHVVRGTTAQGPMEAPVCIMFQISDGLITRIDEYVDSAAVTAML